MKNHYYYKALRKTIIQFLNMFNDISVIRYDSDGSPIKTIEVPLKFSPKTKIYNWIMQKKSDIVLPIMSGEMKGLSLDTNRMVNKERNIVKSISIDNMTLAKFLNPVPYNVEFSLNIWSLYMTDIDQIIEQILPYFTPEAFIRIHIPELNSHFDIKVILTSCSQDITGEYADDESRNILWNIDFSVHTYMFKPVTGEDGSGSGSGGLIEKVITNLYTNKDNWELFKDNPELSLQEISLIITGTGYDEDSKKLYEYERLS